MARTPKSSPSGMSATQAAASIALAALLARRRGGRSDKVRRVKRKSKSVPVPVQAEEKGRVVERNVRALKKAGKVGEGEREVRRRILKMREEQKGKGKGGGKGNNVDEDEDSD